MVNPCYKCPDRCLYCHSSCKKYQEFRKRLDEAKQKERGAKDAFDNACNKRMKANRKYKNRIK